MSLRNWSYADIESFIEACGFVKLDNSVSGSAITYSNGERTVTLHYHGKNEIKGPDVMKAIIENSGIPEKFWTKEKRVHRNIKKDLGKFRNEIRAYELEVQQKSIGAT